MSKASNKPKVSVRALNRRREPAQKRGHEKVARIKSVASKLLSGDSIERFTTNRIAASAGINVATLYQYFPNKEAIVYALYQDWLADVVAAYDRVEEQSLGILGWRKFFTELRRARESVPLAKKTQLNLDRMMESDPALAALEEAHAVTIAKRVAHYLRAYGTTWSDARLVNLTMLIYEMGWAGIYREAHQSGVRARETREWSLRAYLALIEACLEEER
ncbi:MAG: TetR/AcrR family transcriptional regulator [Pseudomonadota bacterium]